MADADVRAESTFLLGLDVKMHFHGKSPVLSNGSRNENRRALVRVFVKKEGKKRANALVWYPFFLTQFRRGLWNFFFFCKREEFNGTRNAGRSREWGNVRWKRTIRVRVMVELSCSSMLDRVSFSFWKNIPLVYLLDGASEHRLFDRVPPRRDFHDYDFPFSRERRRIVRFVGKTARSAIR